MKNKTNQVGEIRTPSPATPKMVFTHDAEIYNDPELKPHPIDPRSRMDLCCHYFAKGNTVPKILKILTERYQMEDLARETPYADIATAAKEGWLKYSPSPTMRWNTRLRSEYDFLREASIPGFGGRMAVISEAAEMIKRNIFGVAKALVKEYIMDYDFPPEVNGFLTPPRLSRSFLESSKNQRAWWKREVFESEIEELKKLPSYKENPVDDPSPVSLEIQVRLGFSGGSTVGLTSAELGRVLDKDLEEWERELKDLCFDTLQKNGLGDKIPRDSLEKRRFKVNLKLEFINIVPGFDTNRLNHPISTLTSMFNQNEAVNERCVLKCYCAAPFVDITKDDPDGNTPIPPGPKWVEDYVKNYGLDIIVSSAGSLEDKHSTFRHYFRAGNLSKENARAYEILQNQKMEGDILWQPITRTAPLDFKKLSIEERKIISFRPMTLLSLEDLAQQIARKQDVILVLAPCSDCGLPKDQVLKAILGQDHPLISHLVADRETISRIFGEK